MTAFAFVDEVEAEEMTDKAVLYSWYLCDLSFLTGLYLMSQDS